jgi:hypothetical protein
MPDVPENITCLLASYDLHQMDWENENDRYQVASGDRRRARSPPAGAERGQRSGGSRFSLQRRSDSLSRMIALRGLPQPWSDPVPHSLVAVRGPRPAA